MKLRFSVLLLVFFMVGCVSNQSHSLFNGKDLSNWTVDVPKMDDDASAPNPFIIRDNKIVSLADPQGHLISKKKYKNYRLEVEYRFAEEPGNCGVLVHVSEPRVLYKMFPRSIESQLEHGNAGDFWVIGEDINADDMEARRGPKMNWGSTEGTLRRIPNLIDDAENPVGEWNTKVIECVDDKIKVWVNGKLVNYGYNATVQEGKIALQAEGSEVEFRKVVVTPISELSAD